MQTFSVRHNRGEKQNKVPHSSCKAILFIINYLHAFLFLIFSSFFFSWRILCLNLSACAIYFAICIKYINECVCFEVEDVELFIAYSVVVVDHLVVRIQNRIHRWWRHLILLDHRLVGRETRQVLGNRKKQKGKLIIFFVIKCVSVCGKRSLKRNEYLFIRFHLHWINHFWCEIAFLVITAFIA